MRRRGAVVTLVALASVATFATQACSLITSYDGFASTSAATATCGARIPGPPKIPSTDDNTAVQRGAVKSIRFAATDKQPTLGFDLDENCSKAACISRAPQAPGAAPKVGVDNAFGPFIGSAVQGDVKFTDDKLKEGYFGLVIELTKWNQKLDDSAVSVSLYNVVGVNVGASGGQARFDGSDAFLVDQNEVKTGPIAGSTQQDLKAYVTNGTLVAHFPTFLLRLIAKTATGKYGILNLVFREASLVGPVVDAGNGGLQMIGAQLVGRFDQKDILRGISQLGYCRAATADGGTSAAYDSDKQTLCNILDLSASRATDGRGQMCAAGSAAFGMDFVGTSIAPTGAPTPPVLNECPGDPTGADSCGQ